MPPPPVYPGEVLRDEVLTPMELSVYRLAREIRVSRPRLNDVVLGRRAVTTDTALRLGLYFGTTPAFWIDLQARYDLDLAERTVGRRIEQEVAPAPCDVSATDGKLLCMRIVERLAAGRVGTGPAIPP